MRNLTTTFLLLAAPGVCQGPYDWSSGTARETVLNTDLTTITPLNGPPYLVQGGVFVFRNVTINAGTIVRGAGSKPMLWIVTGDMQIDGELTVRGGDGQSRNVLNSAMYPSPGGVGPCGGGNGGRGSSNSVGPTYPSTEGGFGPNQSAAGGGGGGRMSCVSSCGRGSGGGGGSFATAGDPWYPTPAGVGTSFAQRAGTGGYGCLGTSGSASRVLAGGAAGPVVFADADPGNDFWGTGVDIASLRIVGGELSGPLGGQGGGGGGNLSFASICSAINPTWFNDAGGGGGGAGGGVLVIGALGKIVIGASGRIDASGGQGGGGEQAGSNNHGGGGGGGSGGMVILWANNYLEFVTKGETFANGDHDFAISADGGASARSSFAGTALSGKYPPLPGPTIDENGSGGFGGLGIVQIMTRPGTNQLDGTNTLFDDNIHVVKNGNRLTGAEKRRYLAWRGYPNAAGVFVDDMGQPTNTAGKDGDIRPLPVLLPIL
jgi:hypothetical protein